MHCNHLPVLVVGAGPVGLNQTITLDSVLAGSGFIGEDGFSILGSDYDIETIAQSQQLIFEIIASMVDMDITFHKLIWATDYRANIRMVDKFSKGRVFVVGGIHCSACLLLNQLHTAANRRSVFTVQPAGLNSGLQDAISVVTTSIMTHALKTGSLEKWSNSALCMLGIHCRFSDIVLDEFATPVKGKLINPYKAFDDTHLEAGDRAPEAPKILHVYPRKFDVMTLFSLYRPWYHTVLVFASTPAAATPIFAALEAS
ncbi:hypothetical protein AZE42_06205 [Rhizopogon vesiculosus]|uniref:FAD/NAD(P)-binding domain-containing protein n=1 Tax=Rhizopogon vesiculosus TaxID=180088 RepID=A0A1J8PN24_9AGAM|nr:hypothetical protein AZE42_06205 [Rhizopogon vesiculosus]